MSITSAPVTGRISTMESTRWSRIFWMEKSDPRLRANSTSTWASSRSRSPPAVNVRSFEAVPPPDRVEGLPGGDRHSAGSGGRSGWRGSGQEHVSRWHGQHSNHLTTLCKKRVPAEPAEHVLVLLEWPDESAFRKVPQRSGGTRDHAQGRRSRAPAFTVVDRMVDSITEDLAAHGMSLPPPSATRTSPDSYATTTA